MYLALEQFNLDLKRIFWVLMFFRSGQVAKWSKNLFYIKADTSIFFILSWSTFKQQFWAQFFLVNTETNTTNILERSSYYQNNWIVEDYLDSFQILVSNTGYMDPHTLVVKFQRGLESRIRLLLYLWDALKIQIQRFSIKQLERLTRSGW